MAPAMLCQRYKRGSEWFSSDQIGGGFPAAVPRDQLPPERDNDDHAVTAGYAVRLQRRWLFFAALEPALAFGRAGRMSYHCSSYEVRRAAYDRRFCDRHSEDELMLVITGDRLDRQENEIEQLTRFVAGVDRRSSHWRAPDDSHPVAGGRR